MFSIELIERKVGAVDAKVIPMDNLSSDDLTWIHDLGCNMTEEIYNQSSNLNRVRKCDAHLINLGTVRVVLIKKCVLLWTILLGNKKRLPQLDQICQWLNETEHTHKGELMLVEREIQEPIDLLLTDVVEPGLTEEEEIETTLDTFFDNNTPISEKKLTLA